MSSSSSSPFDPPGPRVSLNSLLTIGTLRMNDISSDPRIEAEAIEPDARF